jgi:transposase
VGLLRHRLLSAERQKNDAADAEAIVEAAQRPTMRFVAVKSAEQQASAMVFKTRDLLVP